MALVHSMMGNLNHVGAFDIFMPWLLFLAIIYAIISKHEVFGKEVSVQGVISILLSFFMVNYALPPYFLTNLFGIMGMFVAGGVVLIVLLGMAGIKFGDLFGEGNKTVLAFAIAIIAVLIFIGVGGILPFRLSEEAMITFGFFIIMAVAVYMLGANGGE
ncbi:MAG: hypothetical protein KAJ91_02560 [Candidatus Aenigmarchaeota archaeon]|nr:hypothetical protein [Candidatus Aenigmarchaeota archaeon]MCK5333580.1 hypothetical protein [Candidatus Aenigmarchaeota archaeon]